MEYREYPPSLTLTPYVQCYWILRANFNPFPSVERLIPDGTIELIFNFEAPYRRSDATDKSSGQVVKGSHLVGARRRPYLIEQLGAINHVAVRFKANGLYAFMDMPVSDLTDDTVAVDLIGGPSSDEVEARLAEADTDAERIYILERFLKMRLHDVDHHEPLVREMMAHMIRTNGTTEIKTLTKAFGYSYRQLERKFLAVTGVSPKLYSRIVRFRAVFDQVKDNLPDDWGAIAHTYGYYDQAHFIKEFKAFTGVSPTQFFKAKNHIADLLTTSTPVSNFYNTNVLP